MKSSLFARVLLPVVLVAGAACGDGGDADASGSTFCDEVGRVAAAASEEAMGKAFEAAIDAAPDRVRGDITPLRDAMEKASQGDDDSGFLSDEFRAANNNAVRAMAAECGIDGTDVTAREYRFDGLGETVAAGPTAIHVTNTGVEVHDFLLYKRGTAEGDDLVAIVNDNPNVDDGRLKEVAVALPVQAGQESYLLTDLSAGDYVAVCFIPKGMTSFDGFSDERPEDWPDHRSLGMVHQFRVG